jgi:hypothetical protein
MPGASDEEGKRVGREILHKLAQDILNLFNDRSKEWPSRYRYEQQFQALADRLKLDGYTYQFPRLLAPESDILDTHEARGVLHDLYTRLGLANQDVALHCLELSEQHWLDGKWDDCIGNARRFLEAALREVAAAHSLKQHKTALPDKTYKKAELVRQYLRSEGLLGLNEEEAIRVVYGVLSNAGNHPYIAQNDQARLLRQAALIFAQFVMLRFQGFLAKNP